MKKGLVGYLVAGGRKDKEELARNLYKAVHQIKIRRGEKGVPLRQRRRGGFGKLFQGQKLVLLT